MKEPNENPDNLDNVIEEESIDDRRSYRRKRRIRNQIIVYATTVILLALIVAGSNFGIQTLLDVIKTHQAANANELNNDNFSDEDTEDAGNESFNNDVIGEEELPMPEETMAEEEPAAEISVLDIIVENCLAELTLEEKIAGLFIITPESLTGADNVIRAGDTTKEKLLEYPVGGLVYFGSNIQSVNQVKEMLENTHNYSKYPLFMAIDEEGGTASRLANKNLVENVGPMESIGEIGDPANAREAGGKIGTYLGEFGFNLNFAPVADINSGTENSPMGNRTFGSDPSKVAEMIRAFILGAKETGIYSTLKHFPGLGSAMVDTHEGMAVTERSIDEMRGSEFLPFIAGIDEGVEFIMMSHISTPNITGDNTPASISKKMITEILRTELGFDGIIITDALNMGAITEYYTAAEVSVKAIQAGADMILMPESFEEAYIGITEAVQSGKITEERINESLRRIYRVKYASQVET